jgi:uncharacterized membrane protein YsdA (DUF1294 family)
VLQKVLLFYFVGINVLTFFLYALDKYRAQKRRTQSRISEKELHTFSMLGGFLGATLAMTLFRHKVAKSSFLLKHIMILLIWISAFVYYFTQIDTRNFLR